MLESEFYNGLLAVLPVGSRTECLLYISDRSRAASAKRVLCDIASWIYVKVFFRQVSCLPQGQHIQPCASLSQLFTPLSAEFMETCRASRAWCLMLVIPALGRLKLEGQCGLSIE